jgi:hypothetical protein
VVFVADDLAAWLIGLLADAARKKLTSLILGSEQERALRSAATAAVQLSAAELRPGDAQQAEHVALIISQVFGEPAPTVPLAGNATVLEALQAGIARRLAVLDDASLTGTGQSSAQVMGVPGAEVAQKLTAHLLREIVARGSRGGLLEPLANQLNHDRAYLQGLRSKARSTNSMTSFWRYWRYWVTLTRRRQWSCRLTGRLYESSAGLCTSECRSCSAGSGTLWRSLPSRLVTRRTGGW